MLAAVIAAPAGQHSATGWSICGTKEQILIIGFSLNFDDFLQPKPPILRIFGYFSTENGQNDNFLGLKLLKIINISKKKNPFL